MPLGCSLPQVRTGQGVGWESSEANVVMSRAPVPQANRWISSSTRPGLQQSCSHKPRGGWHPLELRGTETQLPSTSSLFPSHLPPQSLFPALIKGKLPQNLSLDPSQVPRTGRLISQVFRPQFLARGVNTGCWGPWASLETFYRFSASLE